MAYLTYKTITTTVGQEKIESAPSHGSPTFLVSVLLQYIRLYFSIRLCTSISVYIKTSDIQTIIDPDKIRTEIFPNLEASRWEANVYANSFEKPVPGFFKL